MPRKAIPPLDPNLKWFTVEEAAQYLRCGPQKIRDLLHSGQVKAVRFGHFRIDRADLDAWLTRGKKTIAPYRRGTRPWVAKRWAAKRARAAR